MATVICLAAVFPCFFMEGGTYVMCRFIQKTIYAQVTLTFYCDAPVSIATREQSFIIKLIYFSVLSAQDALGLPRPRLPLFLPSMIFF